MKIRIALLALACLLPFSAVSVASPAPAATSAPRPTITIVNLNTADAATLARDMDGIGQSKAKAIVDHRQRNGAFKSVDELALVKGIGSKTLERNRPRLTVGTTSKAGSPTAPKPGAGTLKR